MDESKLTGAGKEWLRRYEADAPNRRRRQREVFLYGRWAEDTAYERLRGGLCRLLRRLRLLP